MNPTTPTQKQFSLNRAASKQIPISFSALLILLPLAAPVHAQTLMVWGSDASGQITGAPEGDFRAVAVGGVTQGLAIRRDGTLALWGGRGDPFAIPPIPVELENEAFRGTGIGRSHAVAIRLDGTLAAWGLDNNFGQLNVPPGRFRAVSGGNRHSVGIARDGTLRGWGANDVHQTDVPDGRFMAVASRVLYTVALRIDGTLFGWGSSPTPPFPPSAGVFATWSQEPDDPVHYFVEGERFIAVAAGNNHALAIRRNGRVVGWGDNSGGALAPPNRRFNEVAAGFGFSVGIDTSGVLWGWGTPGSPPPPLPPGPWSFETVGWARSDTGHYYVPGKRFRSVSAGVFHVAAITVGRPVAMDPTTDATRKMED